MELTWLDSNSWLIDWGNKRILLDPWLVGPLVFGGAEWLFKAERTACRPIPDRVDLMLLSQGLPDHAHPPTLAALDRSIPVVASPAAAQICQKMGYQNVQALGHHQTIDFQEITIEALPGAPVGATTRENAYILRRGEQTIYYEPHGFHDQILQQPRPIDVVITPVIDLLLPLLGAVIKGRESALQLCLALHPQLLLPTAAGGDLKATGLLLKLLRAEGSVQEMQTALTQRGLSTIVPQIEPWQPFTPSLT